MADVTQVYAIFLEVFLLFSLITFINLSLTLSEQSIRFLRDFAEVPS